MSASTSMRSLLAQYLTVAASGVIVSQAQEFPATIKKPTAVVKHSKLERLPSAPHGRYLATVTITIAVPEQSIPAAEDRLDDLIINVINAFETEPNAVINLVEASKVIVADTYIGWDIHLTVIIEK